MGLIIINESMLFVVFTTVGFVYVNVTQKDAKLEVSCSIEN